MKVSKIVFDVLHVRMFSRAAFLETDRTSLLKPANA